MQSTAKQLRSEANWPPEEGEVISFKSSTGPELGILNEVHWGLVWRDFVLEDGRVIPEHRISGCPQPKVWRKMNEVTDRERESVRSDSFRWPRPEWILTNAISLSGQS